MCPDIIHVDHLDDDRLDVYRNVRDADLRNRDSLFMAESERVVRRLIEQQVPLHSILLSPNKYDRLKSILDPLDDDVAVFVAALDQIGAITGFHMHRGVLAAGYRPDTAALSMPHALAGVLAQPTCTLLIVEGVTNVDNMGSLFRNAAAYGVDGIVLDPTCCDPLYRKAIRVSAGHVFLMPYAIADDWPDDLRRLCQEWGMSLVAAETGASAVPLWRMPRVDRMAIMLGSEAEGLSCTVRVLADCAVEIPMRADVPSLNVATAAAVVLYERMRPRDD
jgi:tRNA G18 (ribose-2'-O)-methylase SpoU